MEEQGLVPTHVFLQAGVGAMAGGVAGYLVNRYEGRRPAIGVVEPENMACIYQSALVGDGEAHEAVEQDIFTFLVQHGSIAYVVEHGRDPLAVHEQPCRVMLRVAAYLQDFAAC